MVAFRIQTRNATSLRTRCYALAGSEQLFAITDNSLRKSDWLSDDNDTSSSSPWSITWTSSVILYRDLSISSSHPFSRHLFTHSLFVTQIWKKVAWIQPCSRNLASAFSTHICAVQLIFSSPLFRKTSLHWHFLFDRRSSNSGNNTPDPSALRNKTPS